MTSKLSDGSSHRREKGAGELGMARLSGDGIAAQHPVAGERRNSPHSEAKKPANPPEKKINKIHLSKIPAIAQKLPKKNLY